MDLSIFAILAQDGITSGSIYALLALALVLVFSITRVIFIPLREFVAFGALSLAAIQAGKFPQSATLLLILGAGTFLQEAISALRTPAGQLDTGWVIAIAGAKFLLFPLAVFGFAGWVDGASLPMVLQILLTLAIVAPMGPIIYQLAF